MLPSIRRNTVAKHNSASMVAVYIADMSLESNRGVDRLAALDKSGSHKSRVDEMGWIHLGMQHQQ